MRLLAGIAVATLAGAGTAGQAPEVGGIAGRITLTTTVRGTPLASNAYQPRAVGRYQPPATPEIQNVVVYVKTAPWAGPLPAARHVVEQRNETFLPRVVAATRGSVVAFPNLDPYFHNVFSLSRAATFDLGRYRQGQSRETRLSQTGLIKVYCHIHSHMSASIMVLDHPYFAIPARDGSFALADVPAGRHTVVGWHERVGERSATVEVQPRRTATIDLALPVEGGR